MTSFLKMHLKQSEWLFHPEAVNDDVIYANCHVLDFLMLLFLSHIYSIFVSYH